MGLTTHSWINVALWHCSRRPATLGLTPSYAPDHAGPPTTGMQIYELQVARYRAGLEEVHPSLDASLKKGLHDAVPGHVAVAKEMDALNAQYQFVADEIYDRIAKILKRFQNERTFSVSTQLA